MKFFNKIVLFFVLIFVAAACSPEAMSSGGSDTSAQADGGSSDSSVSNDAGDTDSVSNDVVSADKVDNDTTSQTDVVKPVCPYVGDPAGATLEIKLADGPQCFVPGSDEAAMVLAFVNAKIGIGNHPLANMLPADPPMPDGTGGCSTKTIHDMDSCFPIAKVFGKGYKPKWVDLLGPNTGKNFLVVKFPDDSSYPNGAYEVVIVGCSAGICTLSSIYSDGSHADATYEIATKQLAISVYVEKIFAFTDVYKLE